MIRSEWKKFKKKKGKFQRQRIKEYNCSLGQGSAPRAYQIDNLKTRRESRKDG